MVKLSLIMSSTQSSLFTHRDGEEGEFSKIKHITWI